MMDPYYHENISFFINNHQTNLISVNDGVIFYSNHFVDIKHEKTPNLEMFTVVRRSPNLVDHHETSDEGDP